MSSMKPGELYWSRIEPYWLRLNATWEYGPAHFLEALRAVSEPAQHLYAAHWCQSEICNGGLHQFFFNTTGILAPEAVVGFSKVGASELADILFDAMRYFGEPYPRRREERVAMLPATTCGSREDWDPFGHLDDKFYHWLGVQRYRWEGLADRFAADT